MRRRDLFLAAPALLSAAPVAAVKLHASTYAMQRLEPEAALEQLRRIRYDGAELCLMPEWPSAPERMTAATRSRIRAMRFPVPTLIENFNTLADAATHARTLDRIRAASAMAHDLDAKNPPLLQTVLGGKPPEWEQVKETMASRLADWARVAEASRLRLAVKSHIGSASNTPEKLLWLIDRVNSPALSAIYDYSHFQLLDLPLRGTLEALLPRTSFLTIKDGRMENGIPRFLLPGDGTVDYREYFDILRQRRYRGWMLVEISRQLQTAPGFDPIAAARRTYQNIAPLLARADLRNNSA